MNRVFVVDEDWKLIDDIALRRRILAEPEDLVESVVDQTFAAAPATADREEAVHMIQRYDQVALPVVDSNGVLVGIVTVDDVPDVAREEATEDFHKLGSTLPVRIGLKEPSLPPSRTCAVCSSSSPSPPSPVAAGVRAPGPTPPRGGPAGSPRGDPPRSRWAPARRGSPRSPPVRLPG